MASLKITLPSEVSDENPIAGDIYLTANRMRLTETLKEEVAQQLYIRFRIFLEEWFLDATIGVPWRQVILGQKTPRGIVVQILKRVITTCPGVAAISQFAITDFPQRRVLVRFACLLKDGTVLKSEDYGPFIVGPGA